MRTLTTKKGRTIETPYQDDEALTRLRDLPAEQRGDFGTNLLRKADRYGLTPDQLVWVHILVVENDREPVATIDLGRIVEILYEARTRGLRNPRIRLRTHINANGLDPLENGIPVVLSLAGNRARVPGSVNITDGKPFGDNRWFGRIMPDGSYTPTYHTPDAVVDVLKAFAEDPALIGAITGQYTGRCAFCGRELTTKESVGAGYGPVCAAKFGLPWGDTTLYEKAKTEAVAAAVAV